MGDVLAALRRDLEQTRHDAAEAREQGWRDAAVILEDQAAHLELRIDTLELADGNSFGAPVSGWAA